MPLDLIPQDPKRKHERGALSKSERLLQKKRNAAWSDKVVAREVREVRKEKKGKKRVWEKAQTQLNSKPKGKGKSEVEGGADDGGDGGEGGEGGEADEEGRGGRGEGSDDDDGGEEDWKEYALERKAVKKAKKARKAEKADFVGFD